jgi:hypothetical protein
MMLNQAVGILAKEMIQQPRPTTCEVSEANSFKHISNSLVDLLDRVAAAAFPRSQLFPALTPRTNAPSYAERVH